MDKFEEIISPAVNMAIACGSGGIPIGSFLGSGNIVITITTAIAFAVFGFIITVKDRQKRKSQQNGRPLP